MTAVHSILAGIDVSKDTLDVYLVPTGKHLSVPNDLSGLKMLTGTIAGLGQRGAVAMEASGGYERLACEALAKSGYGVRLLNPAQVRHFAGALGQKAKNDRLDAKLIARCASAVDGPLFERCAKRQKLKQYTTLRQQTVTARTAARNQAVHLDEPKLKAMAGAHIAHLDAMIAELDVQICALQQADAGLAQQRKILLSVPGIGEVNCAVLAAFLPELGALDRRRLAALAGLAPFDNESGRFKGKRRIAKGRKKLRAVLCMAAMSACQHNRPLKAYYEKLSKTGKPKMVALTALMRKMLTILNAMCRDGKPWNYQTP